MIVVFELLQKLKKSLFSVGGRPVVFEKLYQVSHFPFKGKHCYMNFMNIANSFENHAIISMQTAKDYSGFCFVLNIVNVQMLKMLKRVVH